MRETLTPFRLSLLDAAAFEEVKVLGDDDACLEWLWVRRTDGDGTHAWCEKCVHERRFHRSRTRSSYTCDTCGSHVHPTSGTLFEGSSTPLSTWMAAIEAIRWATPATPTARELEQLLALPYATARRIRIRVLEDLEPTEAKAGAEVGVGGGERGEDDTREMLLEAAAMCIAERGYDGARVKDIAERANVSSAAVLYHFNTRSEVLLAALQWATKRASDRREEVLRDIEGHDAKLAALTVMSLPSTEMMRAELLIWNEYFARTARGELSGADESVASRYRNLFDQVLRDGISAGAFAADPDELPELLEEFLALLDGLALATLVGRSWMPTSRTANILSRFVRREFGVDISDLITANLTTPSHV